MRSLIITSGNAKYFDQLKNFVDSLRIHGQYTDAIAICDNAISGSWDNPGTWSDEESFSSEQLAYFKENEVTVYPLPQLIAENEVSVDTIKNIKSPTQRYPYKFIYNTLISKKYINKVDAIFYFDSDIYFQSNVKPLTEAIESNKISIVKEFLKMEESSYLNKWLNYSDFSKVSSQGDYLKTMMPANNFCSGFYGGHAQTFHKFNLLALLLTSNQFVNFYSDQPLVNILKTFFNYPFKEIENTYCLHIGELKRDNYTWVDQKINYKGTIPICVHFNSGKYQELESILKNGIPLPKPPNRYLKKLKSFFKK